MSKQPTFPVTSSRYYELSDELLREAVGSFFATVITDAWWVKEIIPTPSGGCIVKFEERIEPRGETGRVDV